MKHLGVQSAILSVSAPGACVAKGSEAQATLARRLNEYAAALRDEDHANFGFFASLPDVLNTSYAIAEIEYALDTLQADGVTLFTRYGSGSTYLGHSDLDPIWKELDKRAATVFVHPTRPANPEQVNQYLPLPIIDFPHETTRAALDMITSRTLKRFPNVKVILSHAGGTLPFLMSRVLSLSMKPSGFVPSWVAGSTHEDVIEAFRSFYYDITMSASPQIIRTLLELVPEDHVVFGVSLPNRIFFWYPTDLATE